MEGQDLIVKCAECGARNRIPRNRTKDRAVCGKCGHVLSLSYRFPPDALNISDLAFVPQVIEFPGPVAVEFWSPRCGHCHRFAPVFDAAARHFAGRIKFGKVNVDEAPVAASKFGVHATPTVVLLNKGREVDRISGAVPGDVLDSHLRGLL